MYSIWGWLRSYIVHQLLSRGLVHRRHSAVETLSVHAEYSVNMRNRWLYFGIRGSSHNVMKLVHDSVLYVCHTMQCGVLARGMCCARAFVTLLHVLSHGLETGSHIVVGQG